MAPPAPVAPPRADAPPGPPAPRSSTRSSGLIGAGILISRLLGLVRQSLIARYLGAGIVSDAFNGAFRLTNFLQNLFGEGALSASFIPVYARSLERETDETADRIAGAIAALLALVTSIIVVLGILGAPYVVELFVGGFTGEKRELAIRLTRILFPGAGVFVLSAWCLGILNSHRRFFLSYVAPVFWNLAMLLALVVYGGRRGEVDLAVVLAWASVIGAVLQMGVQLPTVFGLLTHFRPHLDLSFPPVREIVVNFVPAFVARGVVQLSTIIDMRLASYIAADGVVTLLQNASTIYILPISLFGMAVSAAELPEMARESGTSDQAEAFRKLQQRLNAALPRVAYFVVPSAIAFLVVGQSITDVLLRHGKFTSVDSMRTWAILAGPGVGLLASALGRLYSTSFYALKDTRTPLRFAIVRVALTGLLGYLFAFPLPRLLGLPAWWGAAGLTASAGIAGWVEYWLLRRAITARIGPTRLPPRTLATLWGAGLAAAVVGWGTGLLLASGGHMVRGFAVLAAFSLAYGLVTLALGVPEARGIVAKVLRR
ncbi:MAG: murein biosynthesis integral membrane protein MurJ [Polaromonas sp.]|nr:murein biosynthesis integral membrane protein MurJ [Gemmatimonadaceae bacterium]